MELEEKLDPIDKLGLARDFATKEANRFLVAGIILTLIYLAKVDGIGLDQIIFGKKLSGVQVGAFVYLIAGQFSSVLAQMRYSDAATFERRLSDVLGTAYGPSGDISRLFPNPREWFSPTLHYVSLRAPGRYKVLFWLAAAPSTLLALVAFALPMICGFYYVGNPLNLRPSLSPNIELTLVVLGTIVNLLWLIQSTSHVTLLETIKDTDDADRIPGSGG